MARHTPPTPVLTMPHAHRTPEDMEGALFHHPPSLRVSRLCAGVGGKKKEGRTREPRSTQLFPPSSLPPAFSDLRGDRRGKERRLARCAVRRPPGGPALGLGFKGNPPLLHHYLLLCAVYKVRSCTNSARPLCLQGVYMKHLQDHSLQGHEKRKGGGVVLTCPRLWCGTGLGMKRHKRGAPADVSRKLPLVSP